MKLDALMGDHGSATERRYSVQRIRVIGPAGASYHRVEWAKRIVAIYHQNLSAGRPELPYPAEPVERHQSKNQREARQRGGFERARRIREALVRAEGAK